MTSNFQRAHNLSSPWMATAEITKPRYGRIISNNEYPSTTPWQAGIMVVGPCYGVTCCNIWSSRRFVHSNISLRDVWQHRLRSAAIIPMLTALYSAPDIPHTVYRLMCLYMRFTYRIVQRSTCITAPCPVSSLVGYPARMVHRRRAADGRKIDGDFVATPCRIRQVTYANDAHACAINVVLDTGEHVDRVSMARIITK